MIARFDLTKRAASFDFFTWMIHVKMMGATEIVFGTELPNNSAWSDEEIKSRFKSIVEPAPAMLDMPFRYGDDGEHIGSHKIRYIKALYDSGMMIPRLRSVKQPGKAKYTVTLRKATLKRHRDSDERLWRAFAERIGAVVIEDYSVKPIDLYDRFALYAGARMNYGVVNGPISTLFFTEYPVMQWDCMNAKDGFASHSIEPGQQYPWSLPHQKLVWQRPTMGDLLRSVDGR